MAMLNVQDGSIYYEDRGDGPVVVLAHGIGGNHAIWFEQLAAFTEYFRVITFDHRGFGNSEDHGEHGRSMFVTDLQCLLDHLDVRNAALVGQSMGGGTCLGLTATDADRISTLILCDSLHGFVETGSVKAMMDEARQKTARLSQLERVLSDATRVGDPTRANLYSQLSSFNRANRHNLKGKFSPLIEPQDLADTGVPVLFLVGQYDILFPATAVREMHRQVEGSEFVEVAGAGHSVFFENPAKFNQTVIRFLTKSLAR